MPSSIEKLIKILKLEAELGYENRAVVGGLEKFLPVWENEARSANLESSLIQSVTEKIQTYRDLDTDGRAALILDLGRQLRSAQPAQATQGNSAARPVRQENPRSALVQMPQEQQDYPPAQTVEVIQETGPTSSGQPPIPARRPRPATKRLAETPATPGIGAPLTVLNGIGPKNGQILKGIGLNTLEDLLYYFPRRYDDYSQLKPINRLKYNEEITVLGMVQTITSRPVRGGQFTITEAVISDSTGYLRLTWFNQPWLNQKLREGTQIVVSGKVEMYLGRLVMNNPDWELIEQEHLHTNRIVPVYSLAVRITQRWLRKIMYQTVTFWAPRVPDYLPATIRESAGLIGLPEAIIQTHFPDSQEKLKAARERLAFDEIFFLQLGVMRQKRNWQAATAQVFETPQEWLDEQVAHLPFQLTSAQNRVLADVQKDLAAGRPMNRLLQGDVGSGKTVVAAMAIAMVARQGAQSALMAPTSILAEQHFRSLSRLLAEGQDETPAFFQPGEIRLLIGDTPEPEKREIRESLANGTIKLIIGTHALLEDPVSFQRLQLAVVDEQHRFGVAQRAILRSKGENPHLLVMTATPIPRSLALTVYGDLDLSVMDEMPVGRLPVETHVVHPLERERAYHLIENQIALGHQAFIIYPLVEKGDREEGKAAVDEHSRLQSEIFPKFKLGLMHGRLRPEEKDDVMRRFRDGEYQILVSTSVVEVGVDVPNATVMLIEAANHFGLAQLHKFRGRVGRGAEQSICLLIPENEDAVENERLAVMEETTDGFVLAERDLQQRGPGEFLGTRQSGYSELQMANLMDIFTIEKARQQAQALFERDPELSDPENDALARTFRHFWGLGRGDVS
jgi:ATP-dependent DNA helicase RecG